MERTYINEVQKEIGSTVKVQGFIENLRNSKYMAFIVLKDITGKLQITVEKADHPDLVDTIDKLTPDSVITVTGKVDAKDGAHSPTVTVHETGTYYWREKVYDQTGKLISYGDARKSNETVLVKEKGLASTGVGTPMLLWAGVLAGAGIALALAGSRKRIRL